MGELEDIYTREWFEHDFAELGPEFDLVADTLCRTWPLVDKAVLDVGCGPGLLVGSLVARGVWAEGIEGSSHGRDYAAPEVRALIKCRDLRELKRLPSRLSLVVCTEVAEHLDAQHADHLVALLASGSCPIVFTAAPPGQDGHHHVNCQYQDYWIQKFRARGLQYDLRLTGQLAARWEGCLKKLSHMTRNLMVFT